MKYFGAIRKVIKIIEDLDINNMAYKITMDTKTQRLIINLNKDEQLFKQGIDSTGTSLEQIGGSYSDITIYIKRNSNPPLPTDHITLFQSGEFYDSFQVEPYKGGFHINADTDKEDGDLQARWGFDILGLTDESKADLVQYYRNEILKEVKRQLFKV